MTIKEIKLGNSILALLSGAAAIAATAFLLYPLENLVADRFFEMHFGEEFKGYTKDDYIFFGSIILWLTISAIPGGLVCSYICKAHEYKHSTILCIIIFLLLAFAATDTDRISDYVIMLVLFVCTVAAIFAGTRWGIRIKERRRIKQTLS